MSALKKIKTSKTVINEKIEFEYYKIFLRLRECYGFHYMFFSLEENQTAKRTVFSTDPAWQDIYINNNLIDDCPLYSAAVLGLDNKKPTCGIILPWDSVSRINKKQNEIMGIRSDHGISSGLSIGLKHNNNRALLGLGTDYHNRDFLRLVTEDFQTLKTHLNEAIKLAYVS